LETGGVGEAMVDNHIFIMGPARSGTNMLARALACCPETYVITEHKRKSRVPEEQNTHPDQEHWQRVFGLAPHGLQEVNFDREKFSELNGLWTANAGGKRLILKNPKNLARAREIRQAFPNAKFVWLLREPWAVIQSMFGGQALGRKHPRFLPASDVLKLSEPLLRAAATWVYATHVMREVGTSADIITRYEDLVSKPHQELKRITEHLSLTYAEEGARVPQARRQDFRVANYLLHRSRAQSQVIELLAPTAVSVGYPPLPPGFRANQSLLTRDYLMTYLRHSQGNLWRHCRVQRIAKALKSHGFGPGGQTRPPQRPYGRTASMRQFPVR
jgi:hypothetical protein